MLSRVATRGDIAAMHRVRVAVRENRLSSPGRITESDYIEAMENLGRGWVVEADGEIVAFAVGYRDGNIWALFVDPEHEGRGYGKELHGVMVDWLWSQGLSQLWLTTQAASRAEKFYLAQGWRSCGLMADGNHRFEMDRR